MNLQSKNGKKYHIFGKKSYKKFIFPYFRVTLPYFPKKVLFLTFFGVAPDFGSHPILRSNSDFDWKNAKKYEKIKQICDKRCVKNDKKLRKISNFVTKCQCENYRDSNS